MNGSDRIVLKPGREKSVLAKHPWIFSGAVDTLPVCEDGQIVPVYSSKGLLLGSGMCNKRSQIVCRMLAFDHTPPAEAIQKKIKNAIELRKQLFDPNQTTGYRLINAEGDGLSGLIIDKYDTALVIQVSTAGIERVKTLIVETLLQELCPTWIYEKSTAPARKEEGLQPLEQTLFGTPIDPVVIKENGLLFLASILTGQKTGFFLDQREMRQLVKNLSRHKKVLNCFSYTGAFTIAAMNGDALIADSVDISQEALSHVKKHIDLNGFSTKQHHEFHKDVFEFLRDNSLDYDLVILDPPAFAKRKHDITQAARAYKEINRQAMQKMPKNSYLLTCSCSYHIDESLFRKIIFGAALDAKRDVRILEHHRIASDHALNIYHPEGSYLKSFLCYIS